MAGVLNDEECSDEPLGFYFSQSIAPSVVCGSICLNGVLDSWTGRAYRSDRPHHLVYATPQSLITVPISYSEWSENELGVDIEFGHGRSTEVLDGIRWMWEYKPPLDWLNSVYGNKEDRTEFIKSVCTGTDRHDRHGDLMKMAKNYWLKEDDDWANVIEGCLVLTDKMELLLFGVNIRTTRLRLMSKLSLPDQHILTKTLRITCPGPIKDSLTIDPYFKLIIMSFFPHRMEFLNINPKYPFAFGSCCPHRSCEIRPIKILLLPQIGRHPNAISNAISNAVSNAISNAVSDAVSETVPETVPEMVPEMVQGIVAPEGPVQTVRGVMKRKSLRESSAAFSPARRRLIVKEDYEITHRSNYEPVPSHNTINEDDNNIYSPSFKMNGYHQLMILSPSYEHIGISPSSSAGSSCWNLYVLSFQPSENYDISLMNKTLDLTLNLPDTPRPLLILHQYQTSQELTPSHHRPSHSIQYPFTITILGYDRLTLLQPNHSPTHNNLFHINTFQIPNHLSDLEDGCQVPGGLIAIDETEQLIFISTKHNTYSVVKLGSASIPTVMVPIVTRNAVSTIWIGSELSVSETLTIDFSERNGPRVLKRKSLESLAPILDFVDLSAKYGIPPVVVGGWGSNGGIRIIRPGISARELARFPHCMPFSRIFPIPSGAQCIAILSQSLGPSYVLSLTSQSLNRVACSLAVHGESDNPSSLFLEHPTIQFFPVTWNQEGGFIQVTSYKIIRHNQTLTCSTILWDGCSTSSDPIKISDAVLTDNNQIIFLAHPPRSDSALYKLRLDHHPYLTETSYILPHSMRGHKLAIFKNLLVMADYMEARIYMFDAARLLPHHQIPYMNLGYDDGGLSLKVMRIVSDQDPTGFAPLDLAFLAANDLTERAVLVVLTVGGEIVTIDFSVPDMRHFTSELEFTYSISAMRRVPLSGGYLLKIAPSMLLAVGQGAALVYCDVSAGSGGSCSIVHTNLPANLTTLCSLEFVDLLKRPMSTGSTAARSSEIPMLWVSVDRQDFGCSRLSLGIVDIDWQTKRQTSTLTGFCLEHVEYHAKSKCFVAAGLEGNERIRELDDIVDVHELMEMNKQSDLQEVPARGVLILLKALSDQPSLTIHSSFRLGTSELPTALKCCRLDDVEYIVLGSSTPKDKGVIRLISIRNMSPYNETRSSGTGESEGIPAAVQLSEYKVCCLAALEVDGPVNALSMMFNYITAGVGNSLRFYKLMVDEVSMDDPGGEMSKRYLKEISNYVMYNSIEDIQPVGSWLLVGDCQRSCGVLEVQKNPDGVSLVERAHDINCVSVVSTACVDENTYVISDDNKNIWILRKTRGGEDQCGGGSSSSSSSKWDTLTRLGCFRANQQINKLKCVDWFGKKLMNGGGSKIPTRRFLMFPKHEMSGGDPLVKNQLMTIQWVSREGGVGYLVPIYSSKVMKQLSLLTSAIADTLSFLGDICPHRSRACIENNMEVPSQNVIDGLLLQTLISRPLQLQKKVFTRFKRLQMQSQYENDLSSVSIHQLDFASFINEIELLVTYFQS